jgi:hypothetical protein
MTLSSKQPLLRSTAVTLQLCYTDMSHDPAYVGESHYRRRFGGEAGKNLTAELNQLDVAAEKLSPGDVFPVRVGRGSNKHDAIVKITSTVKSGSCEAIVITVNCDAELSTGSILHRMRAWNEQSQIDGHCYWCTLCSEFATVVAVAN